VAFANLLVKNEDDYVYSSDDGPPPLVVIPVLLQHAASLGQACSLLENIINNQSCITI
jgi:hypothetical protein